MQMTAEPLTTRRRACVIVFLWLGAVTLVELVVTALAIPKALMAALFVLLALLKAGLIAGFFMHLAYEKVGLIYSLLLPLILLVALIAGVLPDALSVVRLRAGY